MINTCTIEWPNLNAAVVNFLCKEDEGEKVIGGFLGHKHHIQLFTCLHIIQNANKDKMMAKRSLPQQLAVFCALGDMQNYDYTHCSNIRCALFKGGKHCRLAASSFYIRSFHISTDSTASSAPLLNWICPLHIVMLLTRFLSLPEMCVDAISISRLCAVGKSSPKRRKLP